MKVTQCVITTAVILLSALCFNACDSSQNAQTGKDQQKTPRTTVTERAEPRKTPLPLVRQTPGTPQPGTEETLVTATVKSIESHGNFLAVRVSLANKSDRDYVVPGAVILSPLACQIGLGGVWYSASGNMVQKQGMGGDALLAAGESALETNIRVLAWDLWADEDGYMLDPWPEGKQKVQVAVALQPAGSTVGEIIVTSEPVEIDIQPAEQSASKAEPPADPDGWGKAFNGVQAKMMPDTLLFEEDGVLSLEIALRNTSTGTLTVGIGTQGTAIAIEAEGKTHYYDRTDLRKPQEEITKIVLEPSQEADSIPVELDLNGPWGLLFRPIGQTRPQSWEPGGGFVYLEKNTGWLRLDPNHPDAKLRNYVEGEKLKLEAGKKRLAVYVNIQIIDGDSSVSSRRVQTQPIEVDVPKLNLNPLPPQKLPVVLPPETQPEFNTPF